jgi:hypothetical protein
MIIPNVNKLTDDQLKEVTEIVGAFGSRIQTITGPTAVYICDHWRRE